MIDKSLSLPSGSHRAREYMLSLGRQLPTFWRECEKARQAFPASPGCYLSDQAAGEAFVSATQAARGAEGLADLKSWTQEAAGRIVTPCTTLACWRMTQGIYRVDHAVYESLITTPLTGEIPADVLMRLPEWCIYIETPGLKMARRDGQGAEDLAGVFVRIDEYPGAHRYLSFSLDVPGEPGLITQTLELQPGKTVDDMLRQSFTERGIVNEQAVAAVSRYTVPIINLLLYICSTTDVHGKHGTPGNPVPVRTRRDGPRLFPADNPRVWDVGVRMGAALRSAYQAEQTSAGAGEHSGPRGHVRRAHWHGFRSGPRKRDDGTEIPLDKRKFDLRWLPPIPVNLAALDDLPSVVRPVK